MSPQATCSDAVQRPGAWQASDTYRTLYRAQLVERIGLIKAGVRAADAKLWLEMPTIGAMILLKALDLPAATFNRKVRSDEKLSKAESERVVGFVRLVGQLEAMIDDVGTSEDFDARSWMSRWLTEPLPALGNAKPIDHINTLEGQNLISQKLAQIVSGAYA